MAVFVAGLAGILVFYLTVLAVGIWAGRKQKNYGEEELMLAGRSVGVFVGVFTLIATWVGGGYINATTEAIFTSGLAWCQVPIGYSLSLMIGALLFVKPMREANYVTMLDPFQAKYGNRLGGLLFLPALCADVFWCAAILSSLGSSLVVILEMNSVVSILISATFAATYIMVGGMYSVTYTDVVQLICIIFGLVLSAPFAYFHPEVSHEKMKDTSWIGEVANEDIGSWVDGMLLLIFGGIPWQTYFQRILSIKTTKMAKQTTFFSTFGCILIACPAIVFGIIGRSTDWPAVAEFNRNITSSDANVMLPLVLRYLIPPYVSFFGLGAITAAVMSSADASILASSAIFARNVYKLTIRPTASEKEVMWVMRIAVLVISYSAAAVALTARSIYYLAYLCSDLVYVIMFPQLLLVVHWSNGVTKYGCLVSYAVGLILRIVGGEPGLGIPTLIHYPMYDDVTETQKFPFRTFAMCGALFSHIIVSCISRWLFESGTLSADRWDFLLGFPECHLTRIDHKDSRNKDSANKGRTNKALHDAVVGKRLSQVSDGFYHDDDSLIIIKRDRSELTNQTSTTSEEPSISKF
uniref:High-affinity choline transporter 1 n=1 Tax=Clastoptera arizonana TaxID=38151 RepID=A0A1B6BYQ9_9HEMI